MEEVLVLQENLNLHLIKGKGYYNNYLLEAQFYLEDIKMVQEASIQVKLAVFAWTTLKLMRIHS